MCIDRGNVKSLIVFSFKCDRGEINVLLRFHPKAINGYDRRHCCLLHSRNGLCKYCLENIIQFIMQSNLYNTLPNFGHLFRLRTFKRNFTPFPNLFSLYLHY